MPDMSALDDILVEIAQTALPSTRRHSSSLERQKKDILATPTRTRPSLPNLSGHVRRDQNQNDLIHPHRQATTASPISLQSRQQPLNIVQAPLTDVVKCNGFSLGPATSAADETSQVNGRLSTGSCTFPRRSARLTDLRTPSQDNANQVVFRQSNDEKSASSLDEEKKLADQKHLACPFDTFLNLEFVDFCSNLASIQLPESVRQSFRKAATLRKRKWRKSMDQMLYTEQVLLQPLSGMPVSALPDAIKPNGCAATKENVSKGTILSTVEEDSFELNEAVRTFEQTLERHLSNTYKNTVGSPQIVEENEVAVDHLSTGSTIASDEPTRQSFGCVAVQYFTIPMMQESGDSQRESLFTVPMKRLPKSGSCLEERLQSSRSSGGSLPAGVSCVSVNTLPTVTIAAHLLESIRTKLATSIEQMHILQTRALVIPQLEARIMQLEEELSQVDSSRLDPAMSDAGIMTTPDAEMAQALQSTSTNTPVRQTADSATCHSPVLDNPNPVGSRGRKVRLPRSRRSPLSLRKMIQQRRKRTKTNIPCHVETLLPMEEAYVEAPLPECPTEESASPELTSASGPPVDYDSLPELQTKEDDFFHPSKEILLDETEIMTICGGSVLSPINEETTEDCISAAPLDKAPVNISTSGVSEDSNGSMSSSNSEELDMMASFATSESSDHDDADEGSYDLLHGQLTSKCFEEIAEPHCPLAMQEDYSCPQTVSKELLAACKVLKDSLHRGRDGQRSTARIESSVRVIQQEWFAVAGTKHASAAVVNSYLDTFESLSKKLLGAVVNLLDSNGNTVLHYALSHNNFPVVSVILDSKVCHVDMVNQAGYTPVMLASLAPLKSETDCAIAVRLFGMGDINRKAHQHGQTALMLAVSHGRGDTVRLLLQVGADVNIQDNDGSTALMCASEHGHLDIVRLLLHHSDIDVQLTDQDGMCALYVAMEAGQKEIAALIYAKTAQTTTTKRPVQSNSTPFTDKPRKTRSTGITPHQTATL